MNRQGKNISKAFNLGEYDKVIVDGKRMLSVYRRYAKIYAHRNTTSWIEYLNFALAVSYFSKSNNELFLEHINALSQYQDIKEFWLALFYLQQNDLDVARMHYNSIDCCEKTQVNRIFLESVLMHKQGECETAKEKLKGIYTELKHPVLKQIADEILS